MHTQVNELQTQLGDTDIQVNFEVQGHTIEMCVRVCEVGSLMSILEFR